MQIFNLSIVLASAVLSANALPAPQSDFKFVQPNLALVQNNFDTTGDVRDRRGLIGDVANGVKNNSVKTIKNVKDKNFETLLGEGFHSLKNVMTNAKTGLVDKADKAINATKVIFKKGDLKEQAKSAATKVGENAIGKLSTAKQATNNFLNNPVQVTNEIIQEAQHMKRKAEESAKQFVEKSKENIVEEYAIDSITFTEEIAEETNKTGNFFRDIAIGMKNNFIKGVKDYELGEKAKKAIKAANDSIKATSDAIKKGDLKEQAKSAAKSAAKSSATTAKSTAEFAAMKAKYAAEFALKTAITQMGKAIEATKVVIKKGDLKGQAKSAVMEKISKIQQATDKALKKTPAQVTREMITGAKYMKKIAEQAAKEFAERSKENSTNIVEENANPIEFVEEITSTTTTTTTTTINQLA
eukprot:Pgem_evm1s15568